MCGSSLSLFETISLKSTVRAVVGVIVFINACVSLLQTNGQAACVTQVMSACFVFSLSL